MQHDDSLVDMVEAPDSAVFNPDGDTTMLAVDIDNTGKSEVNVNRGSRRGSTKFIRGSRRGNSGVT